MPRRADAEEGGCRRAAVECERPPPRGRPLCTAQSLREQSYLTAALSLEPAVTLTRLPAGILISAPVCGLRPVRAAVSTCSNEIQPGIETLLPLATASETVTKSESRTRVTVAWLSPVAEAMLATSSVLVMDLSAMSASSDDGPSHRVDFGEVPLGRSTASNVSTWGRKSASFRGFRAV